MSKILIKKLIKILSTSSITLWSEYIPILYEHNIKKRDSLIAYVRNTHNKNNHINNNTLKILTRIYNFSKYTSIYTI